MRPLNFVFALMLAAVALADTVVMKDGRAIRGTYLGGSPRQVKIEVGDQIQTLDVGDISRIEFSQPSASAPNLPPPEPAPTRNELVSPPPSADLAVAPPPSYGGVQLSAGTNIVVRTIDGIDSEAAHVGQTFAASIDEPVMVNGQTVIPRGADATLKLVDSKESGKLTGRSELTLDLMSVKVNGRMVDVNTQTVSRESSSRGARTAKVAGGTAAVGAIIGAIAGGGKGAAIGAGAGAAAGAGAEVVTKGQRVKIPSETRLNFVLDTPVNL
jgi:hypothetical protein